MWIKCEFCGRDWDTAGEIHGIETCRTLMRDDIAKWRQGVIDANRISQRFESEARENDAFASCRVANLENRLHDMELDWRHSSDEYEKRLHHATAEWQEEKKRARECEKELKENEGVIRVLRRHRDTAEQLLVDLYTNLCNYNSVTNEMHKEDWRILLNEKMEEAENYLGSIGRM